MALQLPSLREPGFFAVSGKNAVVVGELGGKPRYFALVEGVLRKETSKPCCFIHGKVHTFKLKSGDCWTTDGMRLVVVQNGWIKVDGKKIKDLQRDVTIRCVRMVGHVLIASGHLRTHRIDLVSKARQILLHGENHYQTHDVVSLGDHPYLLRGNDLCEVTENLTPVHLNCYVTSATPTALLVAETRPPLEEVSEEVTKSLRSGTDRFTVIASQTTRVFLRQLAIEPVLDPHDAILFVEGNELRDEQETILCTFPDNVRALASSNEVLHILLSNGTYVLETRA